MSHDTPEALRAAAFAVAYRMLGLPIDAEDIAQDSMLQWQSVVRSHVRAPRAYVARIAANKCLDLLRRAKSVPDTSDWLPAPVADARFTEEERQYDFDYGLLVLMQSLSPVERAIFILRSAFECPYDEISAVTGRREEACRKIYQRARETLRDEKSDATKMEDAGAQDLLERLGVAISAGDLAGVTALLAKDIKLRGDGGGRPPMLKHPLTGVDAVAHFLIACGRLRDDSVGVARSLNGAAGLVAFADGASIFALIGYGGALLRRLYAISDPAKLSLAAPVS